MITDNIQNFLVSLTSFSSKKWKYSMGNLIFVIIDQKKIIDLNQFEGTIRAKYNTNGTNLSKLWLWFEGWGNPEEKDCQDWKAKQMQPVWLCILSGRQFEDTFENSQRRKVIQMQPMWLCILSGRQFEDTFDGPSLTHPH